MISRYQLGQLKVLEARKTICDASECLRHYTAFVDAYGV